RCRPRLVVAAWRARVVIFFIVCSRGRWRWRSPVAIHRWTVRWVTPSAFAAADVFGLRGSRNSWPSWTPRCGRTTEPIHRGIDYLLRARTLLTLARLLP